MMPQLTPNEQLTPEELKSITLALKNYFSGKHEKPSSHGKGAGHVQRYETWKSRMNEAARLLGIEPCDNYQQLSQVMAIVLGRYLLLKVAGSAAASTRCVLDGDAMQHVLDMPAQYGFLKRLVIQDLEYYAKAATPQNWLAQRSFKEDITIVKHASMGHRTAHNFCGADRFKKAIECMIQPTFQLVNAERLNAIREQLLEDAVQLLSVVVPPAHTPSEISAAGNETQRYEAMLQLIAQYQTGLNKKRQFRVPESTFRQQTAWLGLDRSLDFKSYVVETQKKMISYLQCNLVEGEQYPESGKTRKLMSPGTCCKVLAIPRKGQLMRILLLNDMIVHLGSRESGRKIIEALFKKSYYCTPPFLMGNVRRVRTAVVTSETWERIKGMYEAKLEILTQLIGSWCHGQDISIDLVGKIKTFYAKHGANASGSRLPSLLAETKLYNAKVSTAIPQRSSASMPQKRGRSVIEPAMGSVMPQQRSSCASLAPANARARLQSIELRQVQHTVVAEPSGLCSYDLFK